MRVSLVRLGSQRGCERHCEFVLEVSVLEREIRFDSLTPAALVVEVHVRALFELLRRDLGIVVTLEPLHTNREKQQKKKGQRGNESAPGQSNPPAASLLALPLPYPPLCSSSSDREEVLVVSPALLLELARREVLVRRALLEVEDEEERVDGQFIE